MTLPYECNLSTSDIVKSFLASIEYSPPKFDASNVDLENALEHEMDLRNIRCPTLEKTLRMTATSVELSLPGYTFEEKKLAAFYAWYTFYVDDMAPQGAAPFLAFQQRLLRGLPQLDPVLEALGTILNNICDQYDPINANIILTSTLDFISLTCMEPRIEPLPLVTGASRFPLFIRDRTGIGAGFALMLFPKSRGIDVIDYIQALPDMMFWTSLVNDILSFHKEVVAGENNNYINIRAHVEGKTPIEVLTEMKDELVISRGIIYKALAHSPQATRAWRGFECGFVATHLAQRRYKLKDLGL